MANAEGTQGESAGGPGEPSRQEVMDNLAQALAGLRAAVDRLRDEVEANAQAEWLRAKPEIRSTVAQLDGMVDNLAQRAKSTLADLNARLDGDPDNDRQQDSPRS